MDTSAMRIRHYICWRQVAWALGMRRYRGAPAVGGAAGGTVKSSQLSLPSLLRPQLVYTVSKAMLQAARSLRLCGRPLGLSQAPRWLGSTPAAAKIKVGVVLDAAG